MVFSGAFGQTIKESADNHFQAGEWRQAAGYYLEYLKSNASDSSAWYNLGYCSEQAGNYDEAIGYFKKAEVHGFPAVYTQYGIAKTYALKGDNDQCMSTLKAAADSGYNFYVPVKNDSAFIKVRMTESFKKILNELKLKAFPCLSRPENRQLDFWVGQWDVYFNDRKVGESSITLAQGGCAIHESYTTSGNFSGQSINFYNPHDKKWHQYWVSSTGGVITFDESDQGEGMLQFTGTATAPNGKVSLNRMTFSRNGDGTVRQLIENSNDNGKIWSTGFDGLYKPRKNIN